MKRANQLLRAAASLQTIVSRSKQRLLGGARLAYLGGGHHNLGDACMYHAASRMFPYPLLPYLGGAERKLERLGLGGRRFFKGCLLGGGTLINNYTLAAVQTAAGQGLPMAALGTGAGSGGFDMPTDISLREWPDLLSRFVTVGVRGPLSLELLQRAGVTNARVVGDLGLLWTRPSAIPADANPPKFAINAIQPHGQAGYGAAELDALGRAAGELIRKGWQAVPVATDPSDAVALEAVLGRGEGTPPVHHPRTADEFLDLVAPCAVMISMRLHGSVLATCAGVPPVIVSYLGKCDDFAASMNLSDLRAPMTDDVEHAVLERVNHICTQGQSLREGTLAQALKWKTQLSDLCQEVLLSMKCVSAFS